MTVFSAVRADITIQLCDVTQNRWQGVNDFNFSLLKKTPTTERSNLQLR